MKSFILINPIIESNKERPFRCLTGQMKKDPSPRNQKTRTPFKRKQYTIRPTKENLRIISSDLHLISKNKKTHHSIHQKEKTLSRNQHNNLEIGRWASEINSWKKDCFRLVGNATSYVSAKRGISLSFSNLYSSRGSYYFYIARSSDERCSYFVEYLVSIVTRDESDECEKKTTRGLLLDPQTERGFCTLL